MKPTEPTAAQTRPQILHRAELVIRTMLTQCVAPCAIARALADAGVLAGTVVAAEPLTAYRVEHHGIPLGMYLAPKEAQAHAKDAYQALLGPVQTLRWDEEEPEDDSVLRLWANHAGDEVETTVRVVPVQVLTSYDRDGEE